MKALLDTNFLLLPHQFGVDIFEYLKYYDIATLSSCIEELKKLAKKKGDTAVAARVALLLLKQKNVKIIHTKEKTVDKAILDYALQEKCTVGTNDKELIKALKKHSVKVIRLKQNKYLEEF
ncbi:MAG: DNA-binding protein [Candidatus Aenigmarchaeota archaeon]|nr:DNA-binding protein [Candidatus Aenigmarchaeota archaeon]